MVYSQDLRSYGHRLSSTYAGPTLRVAEGASLIFKTSQEVRRRLLFLLAARQQSTGGIQVVQLRGVATSVYTRLVHEVYPVILAEAR